MAFGRKKKKAALDADHLRALYDATHIEDPNLAVAALLRMQRVADVEANEAMAERDDASEKARQARGAVVALREPISKILRTIGVSTNSEGVLAAEQENEKLRGHLHAMQQQLEQCQAENNAIREVGAAMLKRISEHLGLGSEGVFTEAQVLKRIRQLRRSDEAIALFDKIRGGAYVDVDELLIRDMATAIGADDGANEAAVLAHARKVAQNADELRAQIQKMRNDARDEARERRYAKRIGDETEMDE